MSHDSQHHRKPCGIVLLSGKVIIFLAIMPSDDGLDASGHEAADGQKVPERLQEEFLDFISTVKNVGNEKDGSDDGIGDQDTISKIFYINSGIILLIRDGLNTPEKSDRFIFSLTVPMLGAVVPKKT